jgi:putative tricarboxylic transport membrane protein
VSAASARADRVVGAVLVCVGLGVLALTTGLATATAADPVGPRGFPLLLGLVVLGCGAALLIAPGESADEGQGRGALAPRQLLGAIGLTALYLRVLEPAGYLLATPPYLAALLLLQGGVAPRAFLGTVVGLPVVLYLLFAVAMRVPLPMGPLEPFLRSF